METQDGLQMCRRWSLNDQRCRAYRGGSRLSQQCVARPKPVLPSLILPLRRHHIIPNQKWSTSPQKSKPAKNGTALHVVLDTGNLTHTLDAAPVPDVESERSWSLSPPSKRPRRPLPWQPQSRGSTRFVFTTSIIAGQSSLTTLHKYR
jgi:hypothetical protein